MSDSEVHAEVRDPFWKEAGRLLNAGVSRSLVLTGNIHDLFPNPSEGESDEAYLPLPDVLASVWSLPSTCVILYQVSGPIRFANPADRQAVNDAWVQRRSGMGTERLAVKRMLATTRSARNALDELEDNFEETLVKAVGRPSVALALIQQMCNLSREGYLDRQVIVIMEHADMLVPAGGGGGHLSDADRFRIGSLLDWFTDPAFTRSKDAAVLISESRHLLHPKLARLPHLVEVDVPSPNAGERAVFLRNEAGEAGDQLFEDGVDEAAAMAAGLGLQALRHLTVQANYRKQAVSRVDILQQVRTHVESVLGEDVVEFKRPGHGLDDVVGFEHLKSYLREEVMPRMRSRGAAALPGAAVAGPIGGGKTFIFEAVAAELGMVVLVLKNIRSQWYGGTDVLFERLRRVVASLDRVLVFVDEADTQFGGVGSDAHETERRLTGKIQAMMSDPALRGKVVWLLMTARIHLLSPDIRRPGRVGDLIIPVLDPEAKDREAFVQWMVGPVLGEIDAVTLKRLVSETADYYPALYAAVRSELKALLVRKADAGLDDVLACVHDILPPPLQKEREYQSLQALVNCTRRRLLPTSVGEVDRQVWVERLRELERQGMR